MRATPVMLGVPGVLGALAVLAPLGGGGCASRRPAPAAIANADASGGGAGTSAAFPGVLTVPATVASSAALTAHLRIDNRGAAPLRLTRGPLELAVLAVEVRDAAGQRVPSIPPPVPQPEDAEELELAPGQHLDRDYALDVFSPPLPPGRYQLVCQVVACAPVTFTVAP